MIKYEVTINERAISVNHMYGRSGSRSFLTNESIQFQERIREAIEEKYGYDYKQIEGKVRLKLSIEKRGRDWDLDNTFKAIIDAIVKAGIIVDDDQVWEIFARKGRLVDCIRIVVEELELSEFTL